jgi:anti-anti-sigma factor
MTNSHQIMLPKRFDYSSSVEFNASLLEVSGDLVCLDCCNLDYIDSAGIGLLVMAQKKLLSKDIKLALVNLKETPKEILNLANLQKIIEFR